MADEDDKYLQNNRSRSPDNGSPASSAVERAANRVDIANIAANAREAAVSVNAVKRLAVSEGLVEQAARAAGVSSTSKGMEAARSVTETLGASSSLQKMIEEVSGTRNFARRMLDSPIDRFMRDTGIESSNLVKNATRFGAIAEMDRHVASAILGSDRWSRMGIDPSLAEKIVRQNAMMSDTISKLTGLGSFARLGLGLDKFSKPEMAIWSKIANDARGLTSMGFAGKALADAMRPNWPQAFPAYRRPELTEIMAAPLGPLASSVFAKRSLLDDHRHALARLRSPWAAVESPLQSITAFGEARALAELVRHRPPQSRQLVRPLREELGDYRDAEQPPSEVFADPLLRTLVQHNAGFSEELAALAPAAVAAIARSLGILISIEIAFDEEQLSLLLYKHCRQLELRLRRFIDTAMSEQFGKDWLKHRTDPKLRGELIKRQEYDIANGRKPSMLFDYADFTDYSRIIERGDNWRDVFTPVFGMKVAFSETMRRLALVRNPTAHFRVVTIEDLLIFAVEAFHLNRWLDVAKA